jgi:hypothetical protein
MTTRKQPARKPNDTQVLAPLPPANDDAQADIDREADAQELARADEAAATDDDLEEGQSWGLSDIENELDVRYVRHTMDGLDFNADGNIVTDKPPYWRPPTTDHEIEAWQKLFRPGSRPDTKPPIVIDPGLPEEDLTQDDPETLVLPAHFAALSPEVRKALVQQFFNEQRDRPTYPELHVDGMNVLDWCNVAEIHALEHPGHSVTVIRMPHESETMTDIVRVTCFGTPYAYEIGERDCNFTEDLIIRKEG